MALNHKRNLSDSDLGRTSQRAGPEESMTQNKFAFHAQRLPAKYAPAHRAARAIATSNKSQAVSAWAFFMRRALR